MTAACTGRTVKLQSITNIQRAHFEWFRLISGSFPQALIDSRFIKVTYCGWSEYLPTDYSEAPP